MIIMTIISRQSQTSKVDPKNCKSTNIYNDRRPKT